MSVFPEQSNPKEEWEDEAREEGEACLCNTFQDMGRNLAFILMTIVNMGVYQLSITAVTNYHKFSS